MLKPVTKSSGSENATIFSRNKSILKLSYENIVLLENLKEKIVQIYLTLLILHFYFPYVFICNISVSIIYHGYYQAPFKEVQYYK